MMEVEYDVDLKFAVRHCCIYACFAILGSVLGLPNCSVLIFMQLQICTGAKAYVYVFWEEDCLIILQVFYGHMILRFH